VASARPSVQRFRDNPVVTQWRTHDRLEQFTAILTQHDFGSFRESAGLVDEMMTDDRISGVMNTRVAALKASPLEFKAARDKRMERKLADILGGKDDAQGIWRRIAPPEAIGDLLKWARFMGVAVAEIVWSRTETEWTPRLIPWHPRHLRWDWTKRTFVMQTMSGEVVLPRPDEQPNGDGKWLVWCPSGVQQGWLNGMVRSLALAYLARSWNFRDWSRYCEKHGMAILVGMVPPGNPAERADFQSQLENVGNESAVIAPQGEDAGQPGFDVKLVEAVAKTYETFKDFKAAIDVDIAVAVLGQNLTTEVQGGSRAAAAIQNLVRLDKAVEDAELGPVIRDQVLTWWAAYNFGDPDLAPRTEFQVLPPEDDLAEAQAMKVLGEAVVSLYTAEPRVDGAAILEKHGVPMISEEELAAIQAAEEEAAPPPGDDNEGPPLAAGGAADEEGKDPATAALSMSAGVVARYTFAGLPIAVENPAKTIRQWTGANGEAGATRMLLDYGFIEGHLSGDGNELDVYIGPNDAARDVYVVHQLKAPDFRAHDEDKCFIGFDSADEAKAAFLMHRNDGDRAFGSMSVIPLERFMSKLRRRGSETTNKIRASGHGRPDVVAALMRLVARSSAVTASAPRTVAGRKRAAKYEDLVMQRHRKIAAKALAVDLAAIKGEIDKATDFADLRKRIIARFRKMDPARLATVVKKANILGHLSGRLAAVEEV